MLTLDIKITNRCNYRCEYCYGLTDNKSMDEKTFKKILAIAKKLNFEAIEFCGGEPLVHPKFDKFTKLAKEFKLILRTNGMLIERHKDLISKYYTWVGVSLDGTANMNYIMRKTNVDTSAETQFNTPINNIIELKKLNLNLKILLGSLVSQINYESILELGNYVVKNKIPVDLWKLYLFRGKRERAKENKMKFILSEEKFDKLKFDGIKTVLQKGSTNSGECFIVSPDGNIALGSTTITNINESDDKIINAINKELKKVLANKKSTYA